MVKPKSAEELNGTGYEWEYAKKIDNRTTGQKIANFIFDTETHAFLGRTAKSWGKWNLFTKLCNSVVRVCPTGLCVGLGETSVSPLGAIMATGGVKFDFSNGERPRNVGTAELYARSLDSSKKLVLYARYDGGYRSSIEMP